MLITTRRLGASLAALALISIAGATSTNAAGSFAIGGGQAAGATVNCSVPNHVVCTVSSDKGIQSVKMIVNTGFGPTAVVDKSYRSCPKTVQVAYDSAYQVSNTQIVECSPAKLLLKN